MKICILSGKGGTGKTTLSVSLATLVAEEHGGGVSLLDCDVEEPNAHLYLAPASCDERQVMVATPIWDADRCRKCGRCRSVCQFGALARLGERVEIFAEHCHSCGACVYDCPHQALREEPWAVGRIFQGESEKVQLVWGELNIGEPRAVPVIEAVQREAGAEFVIVDGPPGTSCALVAAATGADAALIVTEPTQFGGHDLELALDVLDLLEIPSAVVINKSVFGDSDLRNFCENRGVPVLLEIPFRADLARCGAQGEILHHSAPEFRPVLCRLWEEVQGLAQGRGVTV